MAAVAAAIVHQDDVSLAGLHVGYHALDDGIHGRRRAAVRFAPVVRIDLRADDDVAHGLGNGQHGDFTGCFGLMINAVGRPKKQSLHSEITFQQELGKIQFELELGFRNGFKVRMREGVIADFVSEIELTLYDFRILVRGLADHEKGRGRLFLMQDVDDLRCPLRVRAIVECERYFVGQVSHLVDTPGERVGFECLVGEKIGRSIVIEFTPAALRRGGYAPDIALAFEN